MLFFTNEESPILTGSPSKELIQQCANENRRSQLEYWAHRAYAPQFAVIKQDPRSDYECISRLRDAKISLKLKAAIFDPTSSTAQLAEALMDFMEAFPAEASTAATNSSSMQALTADQYWNADSVPDKSPEDWITISHGGGYFHILDFINGRTRGYGLERGGYGIQVTPRIPGFDDRDYFYATRNPHYYFDKPGRLIAKIQRKYLHRANNGYEAGVRSCDFDKLTDISLDKLFLVKSIWGPDSSAALQNLSFYLHHLFAYYPIYQQLEDKLSECKIIESILQQIKPLVCEVQLSNHNWLQQVKKKYSMLDELLARLQQLTASTAACP